MGTALLASIAVFTHGAVHIALCHLFFNIIVILIWFPAPPMRRVPLSAAALLGLYASYYRFTPLYYVLGVFVALPLVALGVSEVINASVAGGVVLVLILVGAVAAFVFWWVRLGGCYKVLSEEDRAERKKVLDEADAELHAAEGA